MILIMSKLRAFKALGRFNVTKPTPFDSLIRTLASEETEYFLEGTEVLCCEAKFPPRVK